MNQIFLVCPKCGKQSSTGLTHGIRAGRLRVDFVCPFCSRVTKVYGCYTKRKGVELEK